MCFKKGNGRSRIISNNHSQFPLLGMVNPTFQNQGTAHVVIDGRIVLPGESYSYDCPNVILQNSIGINFEADVSKTKILYVGFITLEEEEN